MDEESIPKNWSFIPEFYFDLISRIPPGIFLTLILLFEFGFFKSTNFDTFVKLEAGPSFLLLFASIITGQTLGIFLSAIGKKISEKIYSNKIFNNYRKQDFELFNWFIETLKIKLEIPNKIDTKDSQFLYREITEFVKSNSGKSGIILPKLSAEASVCNNSVAAILVATIIHLLHCIFYSGDSFYHWSTYIWTILILSALLWIGKERYQRMIKTLIALLRNSYNKNEKK